MRPDHFLFVAAVLAALFAIYLAVCTPTAADIAEQERQLDNERVRWQREEAGYTTFPYRLRSGALVWYPIDHVPVDV